MISAGEFGRFNIKVKREFLCTASGDEYSNSGNDLPQATCSGLAQLTEGKTFTTESGILFSQRLLCENVVKYFEATKTIPKQNLSLLRMLRIFSILHVGLQFVSFDSICFVKQTKCNLLENCTL